MVTLKIVKEKEYNRYNLVDESTTKYYSVVLEFYNMKKPELNSYLQIDERLLDENYEDYCQPYAFEPTLEKVPSSALLFLTTTLVPLNFSYFLPSKVSLATPIITSNHVESESACEAFTSSSSSLTPT